MVRSFESRPLDRPTLERIVAAGLRAPSAGFTQGIDLLVLDTPERTSRYWDVALDGVDRRHFPWPGLLHAPLLVVVVSSEEAYRRRYCEPDKGGDDPAFEVPWWHVDAAFAALLLQLAAVDAGLGSLFFKAHGGAGLRRAFGIPDACAPVGTVAVGHAAPDRPSSSVMTRRRRAPEDVLHRGRW